MDWPQLIAPIITAAVTLVVGWVGVLKLYIPQRLAQQRAEQQALFDQELVERKERFESERIVREAKIRSEAEAAAYERNRKATHEDRTYEMLHDTLDFIKKRMAQDDEMRERQLDQLAQMVRGITEIGNRYNNLYAAQTLTSQHLAVLTDSVRRIELKVLPDNGNND